MSASNTFAQQLSAQFDETRASATNRLASEQAFLLTEYQKTMDRLDVQREQYLAFVQPILAGLGNLPDHVAIGGIRRNTDKEVEVTLTTAPGVSMASLLMEHPPLPFAMGLDGRMREPTLDKPEEPIYSGILIEKGKPLMHWQSHIGSELVNFTCQTDSLALEPWKNPVETGSPVATVRVGDMASQTPWRTVSQEGHDYWVQPSNPAAVALLDSAVAWQKSAALSASLREEFNERIQAIPTLGTPQAKIVLNALFSWATTNNELPTKEDFAAWTAPRGNVLVMHGPQDWANLTAPAAKDNALANEAQSKIHMLSERLPNIWRFADEAGIAVICDAMAATQTRWAANQEQAFALHA